MAYSHLRLRNVLALVRMLSGCLFLFTGAHKIWSWEFAGIEFPKFMWNAVHGTAVGFYGNFLNSFVWNYPSRYAVLVALTELCIGVGLLLGLAVRPVSLLGMIYVANLMLATWMAPGPDQPIWRYLDNETKLIALFFLFLLFGIGHAGENWGLGALYHRRRHRLWEAAVPEPRPFPSQAERMFRANLYFDEEDQDQVEEIADWREPTSIARQRATYPGRRGGSARAG